jgi:hypothetical protein
MEAAQRRRLAKIADSNGVSVSDVIREAIDAFLERPKEKRG